VFAATIDKVSSLLTLGAMRRLNAAVEVSHQDPATVARKFLVAHGLIKQAANGG
jgi:glycine betaine/choline ABC-type transport system substrate-binding protein